MTYARIGNMVTVNGEDYFNAHPSSNYGTGSADEVAPVGFRPATGTAGIIQWTCNAGDSTGFMIMRKGQPTRWYGIIWQQRPIGFSGCWVTDDDWPSD